MKHITFLAIAAATTCVAVKAAPFMAVGDNAELFVTAAAEIKSDSNVFSKSTNETSDTIYSFTPGLDLVFGKGAANQGNLYYKEEIRRFTDLDSQDTELASVGANSKYDNGVTKVNLNASYAQLAQNDRAAGGTSNIDTLVRQDVTNLGAKAEFGISEKTSLGVGLVFAKTAYEPVSYSDSDIWSIPVDLYVKANPKLDWSLGYRYRSSALSGSGIDSNDNFFNLGARGEFTPKLTGQIRLGYNKRSLDAGGSQDQFGADGNLDYAFSEKTTYSLTFGNDFGSAGTGDSTKVLSLGLNASNRFSEQWSVTAGLNYSDTEYSDRTDKLTALRVSATYTYSQYVNFAATVSLTDNSSTSSVAEFKQNVFSLGANVRY